MINKMNNEEKSIELYQEFRKYRDLSENEKLAFKANIAQESSHRSENEKEAFRQAIKINVDEIKEKLFEIKGKFDEKSKVSA
jgi:arginyl-tRNA synthetase